MGGGDMYGAGDLLRSISGPTEADKPMIIELAVAAMEELIGMAQMGEPLWLTTLDGTTTVLNEDEYIRSFPRGIGPKPNGFKCEASRETAVVIMNHVNLVEILMDVVYIYIASYISKIGCVWITFKKITSKIMFRSRSNSLYASV